MQRSRAERAVAHLRLITQNRGGIDALIERKRAGGAEEAVAGPESLRTGGRRPKAKAVPAALEAVARNQPLTPEMVAVVEAIITTENPACDIVDGSFEVPTGPFQYLSSDPKFRARIEKKIRSIGRIELLGLSQPPYGGTGFVVGEGLVMTNRHVAQIFADGLGATGLHFKPGLGGGIDFLRERDSTNHQVLKVKRVVMIHPYWDMALLQVTGLDASRAPLKLSLEDCREIKDGRDVVAIGYPAYDTRNSDEDQRAVFGTTYMIKRLQPGDLHGTVQVQSFGKVVPAAGHDCSTLGGNSGSAIIDAKSGQVLALHFGGRTKAMNYAVPSSALAQDQRVIDAGVQFDGNPPGGQHGWLRWWEELEAVASDGGPADDDAAAAPIAVASRRSAAEPGTVVRTTAPGTIDIRIPITITINPGGGSAPQVTVGTTEAMPAADIEAVREPEHDTDYRGRRGYRVDFLGEDLPVPMPEARDPRVLARTRSGGTVLRYENFSILMHAKRRLALVTASNITKEIKLRRPDPSRKYTRDALGGLGKNDQERWFLDGRLAAQFQLPDVFFTKDRQAFDKGHLVRRDDVAWGRTYAIVKRANGDTYHVTNCSPQVLGFNRSSDGEDNWGDLENLVLQQAASERLCAFAGPLFRADDSLFFGNADDGEEIVVRIPRHYWKVIVARTQEGLAAYGFVLEQDLSDVDFGEEFAVPPAFRPAMKSLRYIADKAKIRFDEALLEADRDGTDEGLEMVFVTSGVPASSS